MSDPTYKTDDKQAIFDFVVRKLHDQGGQSRDGYGYRCVYRNQDGRKCALGWLIPDDEYFPQMEGKSLDRASGFLKTSNWTFLEGFQVPMVNVELIADLQYAHDYPLVTNKGSDWESVWEEGGIATRLSRVVRQHGLNDSVVTECWPRSQ